MGLNPGGRCDGGEEPSVENGNAYRIECWKEDGLQTPLQKQICLFYESIAVQAGTKFDALMDKTLAANLCPFRSGNWAELPKKEEAIKFSKNLWGTLFDKLNPSVIACVGRLTHFHVYSLLKERAFVFAQSRKLKTGWGKIQCELTHVTHGQKNVMLVGLPHLSRFRIFGRDGAKNEIQYLAKVIAERI